MQNSIRQCPRRPINTHRWSTCKVSVLSLFCAVRFTVFERERFAGHTPGVMLFSCFEMSGLLFWTFYGRSGVSPIMFHYNGPCFEEFCFTKNRHFWSVFPFRLTSQILLTFHLLPSKRLLSSWYLTRKHLCQMWSALLYLSFSLVNWKVHHSKQSDIVQ